MITFLIAVMALLASCCASASGQRTSMADVVRKVILKRKFAMKWRTKTLLHKQGVSWRMFFEKDHQEVADEVRSLYSSQLDKVLDAPDLGGKLDEIIDNEFKIMFQKEIAEPCFPDDRWCREMLLKKPAPAKAAKTYSWL